MPEPTSPATTTEQTPEPTPQQKRIAELRRRLQHYRQRSEVLDQRLQSARKALARAQAELDAIRPFTLDVFPGLEIPAEVREVMDGVRSANLTYLTGDYLDSLVQCVLEVDRSGREGVIIEAGTALGGSAIAMAAAKSPDRKLLVYDAFGMIPPPSERDGADVVQRYEEIKAGGSSGLGGETYYGYREDLLGEVTASFARYGLPVESSNVELVPGLFEETITLDEPVALAHIDGDWFDSTWTCLERITPLLVPGGRLVIDDYYSWSGCRDAVDQFFADRPGFRVEFRAKVHIVRLPA